MRHIFLILLLSTDLLLVGQTCATIHGKKINCTDSAGLRQGLWEIRKEKDDGRSYCWGAQKTDTVWLPIATGQYKDGKKIGTWDYYSDNDHSIFVEKTITYFANGDIEENYIFEDFIIKCNRDTSEINGTLYRNKDKIVLTCKNKKCSFTFDNKKIISFDYINFDTFDLQRIRLQIGMYDRKIKEIKTTR